MPAYDAIVIGAGHNGLVCAAYLARAGLSVVVLERSDRIGGACITEELFEGFRMSTAAPGLSLMRPEIVRELGLKLDIRPADPLGRRAPHCRDGIHLSASRERHDHRTAGRARVRKRRYGSRHEATCRRCLSRRRRGPRRGGSLVGDVGRASAARGGWVYE